MLDTIIRNGTVIDGTGAPGFRADVAIQDGRIAAVGDLTGREARQVVDVCVVVTRYFGGILLGAGGLTRAYAKSAKDALDAAGKARMRLWSAVTVDCPYPMLERLKLLAAAHGGTVEGTDFGAAVSVRILLPQENAARFDAALTELSAGTMTARREGERFLPGPRE